MKANIPSRMPLLWHLSESRIILTATGAEKRWWARAICSTLLGQGKPTRVRAASISPEEIERVVKFVAVR